MTSIGQMSFAHTPWSRMRGLLGTRRQQWQGRQLFLYPCRAIHTFGMRYAIDAAFIDQTACVVEVRESIGRNRVAVGPPHAVGVIERPAQSSPWHRIGERIEGGGESL